FFMFDWNQQQTLINFHDRLHLPDTSFNHYFSNYLDSSCIICYPTPNNPSDQFNAFWNWFTFISSVYQFSRITTEIFDQYIHNFNIPVQTRIVDRLLSSIRFRQPEVRDTLVNQINNCTQHTQLFTQHLEELENLQNLEDYTTTDSNTETSDDEEPDLVDNLMNMNNGQAGQLLNLVRAIGEHLAVQNNVPMPTFIGGIQDPMEWLEEFERCATINRYTNDYKLQVVGGYLMNEWRTDLQNRIQTVGESIDHYAQDIKRLIKRVDHQENWSEQDKIYQFMKRLRREIAFQIRPLPSFRHNTTLEQVIEAARQIDENNKDYPEALMGFGENHTSPSPISQNYPAPQNDIKAAVTKALAPLIQALGRLAVNIPNVPTSPSTQGNNNNINRPWNRQPCKSPTCYKCRQVGHIARNCPTQQPSNFQQPPPNNQNNNIYATHFFAQQQQPQQMYQPVMQQVSPQPQPYIHIEQRNMDIDGNNQASDSGKPRNQSGRNVKAKLDPETQDDEDKEKKRKTSKGLTEKPPIAQMTIPYSIISDLMYTKAGISFGQLMSLPPFKNEVKK
ncbi:20391_t:CDS:2, partial [Dentiscutata erythropus]